MECKNEIFINIVIISYDMECKNKLHTVILILYHKIKKLTFYCYCYSIT